MSIELLGISGSPVPNSNTDWAVRKILKYAELESRFIKLSDYSIQPCSACLGCVEGNECVVRDDALLLAPLFNRARAFVIAGYTPFSSLDARTKSFMERMYCLRHQTGLNRGKLGVAVIMTAQPPESTELPPAAEMAARQIEYWMLDEGMVSLGTMIIMGNVPVIRSGHGDDCSMSSVRLIHNPLAGAGESEAHNRITEHRFDEAARIMGEKIRQAMLDIGPALREAEA